MDNNDFRMLGSSHAESEWAGGNGAILRVYHDANIKLAPWCMKIKATIYLFDHS